MPEVGQVPGAMHLLPSNPPKDPQNQTTDKNEAGVFIYLFVALVPSGGSEGYLDLFTVDISSGTRSPFGSWIRRECHRKGGIVEARLKSCSTAAAVLCIAHVTAVIGELLPQRDSQTSASVSVCSESRPCLLLSWCQKCPSKAMELPVRGRTRARWLHRLDLAPSTELSSP
ncbi:hypothetical protein Anapl_09475 [Anas platyrhynchos]|uniref:Uncharacterized protein n=1 Tax=Anas platyrhynchos TaxID=8839 RepID=R0JN75_ANAPL|nr:hypothetical protein Anapl_09475 [Anas platyrhynchos]